MDEGEFRREVLRALEAIERRREAEFEAQDAALARLEAGMARIEAMLERTDGPGRRSDASSPGIGNRVRRDLDLARGRMEERRRNEGTSADMRGARDEEHRRRLEALRREVEAERETRRRGEGRGPEERPN